MRAKTWRSGLVVTAALWISGCGSAAPPPQEPSSTPPPVAVDPPAAEPAENPAAAEEAPSAEAASSAAPAGTSAPSSAPEPEPAAPPAAPPAADSKAPKLPGANLNVGAMNVDGLQVKHLSCKTSGGGMLAMLGTLTIAAGLSKRKAQLDGCSPAGPSETPIHWKQQGGAVRSVKASGPEPKRNGCVERALKGAPAAQDAECVAVVVHGK